jgi:hypothetical protein
MDLVEGFGLSGEYGESAQKHGRVDYDPGRLLR